MQKGVEGGLKRVVEAGKPPKVKALRVRLGLEEGQVPLVGVAGTQGAVVPLPQPACQINCG